MKRRRRTHGEGSTYQRTSDGRWVGSLRYEDALTGTARRTTVYGVTEREVVRKLSAIRKTARRGSTGQGRRGLTRRLRIVVDRIDP